MDHVPWWIEICRLELCRNEYLAISTNSGLAKDPTVLVATMRKGIIRPANENAFCRSNFPCDLLRKAATGFYRCVEPNG